MARPRSDNPKTEQLNIRLTAEEAAGVDAVTFLHESDNNKAEWARKIIGEAIQRARETDPRVEELIQFRIAARALGDPELPNASE